jgi:hypothetical protein
MLATRNHGMHNISLIKTSIVHSIDHFKLTIGIFKIQVIGVLD